MHVYHPKPMTAFQQTCYLSSQRPPSRKLKASQYSKQVLRLIDRMIERKRVDIDGCAVMANRTGALHVGVKRV